MAWLLSLPFLLGGSQRDTFISSTPVNNSTRQPPMAAARGIDKILPTAALAVALATLDEIQRRDVLVDEVEKKAPRVESGRCSRKKRYISMYVWLGAAAGR